MKNAEIIPNKEKIDLYYKNLAAGNAGKIITIFAPSKEEIRDQKLNKLLNDNS